MIVQNFLANIAARDNFNLVLFLRVANQSYIEVCQYDKEIVRGAF